MKRSLVTVVVLLLLLTQNSVWAQKKRSVLIYPVGFFLPETGFGAGVAGAYSFSADSLSPPSQIQFGAAYTTEKQILVYLPFQFYWNKRKHSLSGEIGYNDYTYQYFGVGYDERNNVHESFDARFPRFRINYLKRLNDHWFTGPRWWFEDYQVSAFTSTTRPEGYDGNQVSGPGWSLQYDSRDHLYLTSQGTWMEFAVQDQRSWWLSQSTFQRYRFEWRYFRNFKQARHIIGLNALIDFTSGNVPFFQLPQVGSAKRLRGFYEGRYRDQQMALVQAEYKWFFHSRWAVSAFGGIAVLSHEVNQLFQHSPVQSAGLGMRYLFDTSRKVTLRLDAAYGAGSMNYYFTIGEAF